VKRLYQSGSHGDVAHRIAATEVCGPIGAITVVSEFVRRVDKHFDGRHAIFERSSINERLKSGAGLTPRICRTIQLRLGIIASTKRWRDISCFRIESYQCCLRLPPAVPVERIESLEFVGDSRFSKPLQIEIDGRVDSLNI